tara:strand:- start:514 stop:879 length:366 start_codon:yes stop_codon:yes gene_type:complete
MSLNVQDPILAGSLRAVYNASSVNDTDWHDLSSSDFVNSVTGAALSAGLSFAFLAVVNKGSDLAHIKYRARTGAGDATTHEIPIDYYFSDDVGTLNTTVSTIAYKKNAGSDTFYLIAGFSK